MISTGTARLGLLLVGMGLAVALAILDKISGTEALAVISAVVGGVLHGAGARQGADAATKAANPPT